MIEITAIDHTCLAVSSLEQSKFYYESLFGARMFYRENDRTTLVFETESVHFFFTEVQTDSDSYRRQHISFRVENIEKVEQELIDRNIPFTSGKVDFFRINNYRWIEWRDPDGIRVECVEVVK